ncbi:MAG: hypothetical protein ACOX5R_02785 [bacterium]|jgi:hypothetical protein
MNEQVLSKRLMVLEKQVRMQNIYCVMMLSAVLFFLFVGMSETQESTVSASAFLLRNGEGKVRGEFSLLNDFPSLILYDKNEAPRVTLSLLNNSHPGLAFLGPNGRAGLGLGLNQEGIPTIGVLDSQGDKRIDLTLSDKGATILSIQGPQEKGKIVLSVDSEGGPILRFLDQGENMKILLNLDRDGNPAFVLSDQNIPRAALGIIGQNATSFILSDQDGKVLFQVP